MRRERSSDSLKKNNQKKSAQKTTHLTSTTASTTQKVPFGLKACMYWGLSTRRHITLSSSAVDPLEDPMPDRGRGGGGGGGVGFRVCGWVKRRAREEEEGWRGWGGGVEGDEGIEDKEGSGERKEMQKRHVMPYC